MPLISVIVPVFNGEKTILVTIESVLKQTFTDFEVIIVNDGSQDATLDIVSCIQDPRSKVFSYPNSGANVSRNRGFYHANSEFIAFLDADDIWTTDKLEAQFRALQDNPQAAVAYSWCDFVDESGKFLHRGSYSTVTGNVCEKLLLGDFLDNGSNPLIRRQAFSEVGGFDESLPAAQDWDLYLRLAARYNFVAVPSTQILYRVSANSISSNVYRLESACLQVLERAFTQAPESLQHLKPYSLANLYKYLTYKVLEAPTERHKGFTAARFLWEALRNDRDRIPEPRILLKILIKIAVVALLPPQKAQTLINRSNTLRPIHNVLLSYIRV
ncbi:glycosyltransferase [Argonema galeatum]|uniref:glycosyltransferase n=1 Tax=Argonema galeatum TaxID=2942762 RepID=UPI0020110174|nr:glycosyltransferase [Argonema galeatum]MCL1464460.1 glycosyltransferase [Argonema galeatum A003/A1]